jgi:hypothetical protein
MSKRLSVELREFVRKRAGRRCEYCLLHEEDAQLPHEPDHVIARKHGGLDREENLAYACFACNRFKGTDITSLDSETGETVRLFHPRNDTWAEHFRLEGARIMPLSAVGRATVFLLQFNRPDRIRARRALIAGGHYPRGKEGPAPKGKGAET